MVQGHIFEFNFWSVWPVHRHEAEYYTFPKIQFLGGSQIACNVCQMHAWFNVQNDAFVFRRVMHQFRKKSADTVSCDEIYFMLFSSECTTQLKRSVRKGIMSKLTVKIKGKTCTRAVHYVHIKDCANHLCKKHLAFYSWDKMCLTLLSLKKYIYLTIEKNGTLCSYEKLCK